MGFGNEQTIINQVLTSFLTALDTWLVTALVLSLFATAAFRPKQIRDRVRFRWAVRLLGIYLIIPVAVGLLLTTDPPPGAANVISQIGLLIARAVLALSIVRALQSLVPAHDVPDEA